MTCFFGPAGYARQFRDVRARVAQQARCALSSTCVRLHVCQVLGLSLGSDVTMRFHPPSPLSYNSGGYMTGDAAAEEAPSPPLTPVDVRLPQRSLYVLTGDARWKWRHEIVRAVADEVDGVTVPRRFRASVTLRGISPRWLPSSTTA